MEKSESLSEIMQIKKNSGSEDSVSSTNLKVSEGKNLSYTDQNHELDKYGPKILDILRQCDLNQLQYKSVARESMKGTPSELFEEMITCFYDGLLSLGISYLDASIVRQSHRVKKVSDRKSH